MKTYPAAEKNIRETGMFFVCTDSVENKRAETQGISGITPFQACENHPEIAVSMAGFTLLGNTPL